MSVFPVVLIALVASVSLPDLGRPLSLSGARLAATEPSDAVIAAMIAARKVGPKKARETAWRQFGRGLNYTRWRFARDYLRRPLATATARPGHSPSDG